MTRTNDLMNLPIALRSIGNGSLHGKVSTVANLEKPVRRMAFSLLHLNLSSRNWQAHKGARACASRGAAPSAQVNREPVVAEGQDALVHLRAHVLVHRRSSHGQADLGRHPALHAWVWSSGTAAWTPELAALPVGLVSSYFSIIRRVLDNAWHGSGLGRLGPPLDKRWSSQISIIRLHSQNMSANRIPSVDKRCCASFCSACSKPLK